jgi:hypothetical protein
MLIGNGGPAGDRPAPVAAVRFRRAAHGPVGRRVHDLVHGRDERNHLAGLAAGAVRAGSDARGSGSAGPSRRIGARKS